MGIYSLSLGRPFHWILSSSDPAEVSFPSTSSFADWSLLSPCVALPEDEVVELGFSPPLGAASFASRHPPLADPSSQSADRVQKSGEAPRRWTRSAGRFGARLPAADVGRFLGGRSSAPRTPSSLCFAQRPMLRITMGSSDGYVNA